MPVPGLDATSRDKKRPGPSFSSRDKNLNLLRGVSWGRNLVCLQRQRGKLNKNKMSFPKQTLQSRPPGLTVRLTIQTTQGGVGGAVLPDLAMLRVPRVQGHFLPGG